MKASTLVLSTSPQAQSDMYPLDEFYSLRGQTMPVIEPVPAREMPEPTRSLLAHENDMTSTLENFHGTKLHVEVLGRRTVGNEYFREVVLRLGQNGRRVEYGAIRILLDILPDAVRLEILRERLPLGRILTESGVVFTCQPRLYLRVTADDFIGQALGLSGPRVLYGRRNTLVDAWERPLAEIVEILPPT
jgi:chorismate-pyruvate lyase